MKVAALIIFLSVAVDLLTAGCGQSCGCIQLKPVGASQSSTFPGTKGPQDSYAATLAIDRNGSTISGTLDIDPHPWLAVELPGDQPVSRVVLMYWNSVFPFDDGHESFKDEHLWKNLQVRVADSKPTTAGSTFTEGTRIGFFKGPSTGFGEILEFSVPKAVTGKWVVVQMNQKQFFPMAEILVYSG